MAIVVVSGPIANKCFNGGAAWTRLSWVLGFKKLGFEVYFVEQISRGSCMDGAGLAAAFEHSANAMYFERVAKQFNLWDSSALVYEDGEQTCGLTFRDLLEIAGVADLLVNISGHLTLEPLKGRFRRKVYVDLDPGFTQFWHASGNLGAHLDGHDVYFTIGENIGGRACPIPTDGIRWHPTRQPVVLEHWPNAPGVDRYRFTTVASWRGPYGPVEHGGERYGVKVHEFRKFVELPLRAEGKFEVALDIHPGDAKDLDLLRRSGWSVVDPRTMAPDPESYRRYIQGSGAEFSVAQGIYVDTQCGWFSDRSARYLASGKPALVQDTGFGRNLPAGNGVIAFRNLQEAIAGVTEIVRNYEQHCRAARSLAEVYFDSNRVLGRLIEVVGISP